MHEIIEVAPIWGDIFPTFVLRPAKIYIIEVNSEKYKKNSLRAKSLLRAREGDIQKLNNQRR